MKMPDILSIPGGKCKQAHDLCGYDVSGSVPSSEEHMCICFRGTDVKELLLLCFKRQEQVWSLVWQCWACSFQKPLGLSRFTGLFAIFF